MPDLQEAPMADNPKDYTDEQISEFNESRLDEKEALEHSKTLGKKARKNAPSTLDGEKMISAEDYNLAEREMDVKDEIKRRRGAGKEEARELAEARKTLNDPKWQDNRMTKEEALIDSRRMGKVEAEEDATRVSGRAKSGWQDKPKDMEWNDWNKKNTHITKNEAYQGASDMIDKRNEYRQGIKAEKNILGSDVVVVDFAIRRVKEEFDEPFKNLSRIKEALAGEHAFYLLEDKIKEMEEFLIEQFVKNVENFNHPMMDEFRAEDDSRKIEALQSVAKAAAMDSVSTDDHVRNKIQEDKEIENIDYLNQEAIEEHRRSGERRKSAA